MDLPFSTSGPCAFPHKRVIDACRTYGDKWYALRVPLHLTLEGGRGEVSGRYYALDERNPDRTLLILATAHGDYIETPTSEIWMLHVTMRSEENAQAGEDPNVLRDIVLGMSSMNDFPGVLKVPYRTIREEKERIRKALRDAVTRFGPLCATVKANEKATRLDEPFVHSDN